MQNCKLTVDCGELPDISRQQVVVGAKQLRKVLKAGKAERVYLAKNADPGLTEPIAALCKKNKVSVVWVKSKTDLGHACGIEVGAAAAAAVK